MIKKIIIDKTDEVLSCIKDKKNQIERIYFNIYENLYYIYIKNRTIGFICNSQKDIIKLIMEINKNDI